MLVERVQKRRRFQLTAASCDAELQRMSAGGDGVFISMDDQPHTDLGAETIAKFDHLFEFVTGVHVKKRKRHRPRIKRFSSQMHEDAGVLTDGIQQHRISELRYGLAKDV